MPTRKKRTDPRPASTRGVPSGAPLPPNWQTVYLDHVSQHGHYAMAAKVAGISQETARRYRVSDPDFERKCLEAREEAADRVELNMMASAERSDNPVPYIVRLKALRPQEYIERHAIMQLSMTAELTPTDILPAIHAMLSGASPAVRALLAPEPAPDDPGAP